MPIKKPCEDFRGVNGCIGYLLRQAQHVMRLKIDRALNSYDMTHPQFSVLNIIGMEPGLHSADIARVSLLSPQATHVIITNLEEAGLIVRKEHEIHGRVLTIELTELGKKRLQQCRRRVNEIEENMVKGLKSEQEKMIRQWLVKCAEE